MLEPVGCTLLTTAYMRLVLQASGSCLKYWPSHCHGGQRYICGLWQASAVSLLLSCACLLPACSTACTSYMRLACRKSSALRAVLNAALGVHLHAGYYAVWTNRVSASVWLAGIEIHGPGVAGQPGSPGFNKPCATSTGKTTWRGNCVPALCTRVVKRRMMKRERIERE